MVQFCNVVQSAAYSLTHVKYCVSRDVIFVEFGTTGIHYIQDASLGDQVSSAVVGKCQSHSFRHWLNNIIRISGVY